MTLTTTGSRSANPTMTAWIGNFSSQYLNKSEIDHNEILFVLNEVKAVAGTSTNRWRSFFVDTLAESYLGGQTLPGVLTHFDAEFLIRRMRADGHIDRCELALAVRLCSTALSVPVNFRAFTEKTLTTFFDDEGESSSFALEMTREYVYGWGDPDSVLPDREQIELLVRLHGMATQHTRGKEWSSFYSHALIAYANAGRISADTSRFDEVAWLYLHLLQPGRIDGTTAAVLRCLGYILGQMHTPDSSAGTDNAAPVENRRFSYV